MSTDLERALEAALFAADEPMSAESLAGFLRDAPLGEVEEALWWWQFSYVSNWGNLAGAALNALLSVVSHDRLDVEVDLDSDQVVVAEQMLSDPS